MGIFSKILGFGNISQDFLLSLDIGTEVVKALVFKINKESGLGIVKGVGRSRQGLKDMHSGAVSDIKGVIDNSKKAIEMAKNMAGARKIEKAVIGIAGELVKGTTTTVHYERIRPEIRIDLPELKNIIQKVQWKAFDRIRQQLAWETGHSEIEVKLINAAIVDVRIDGYKVTNPIGFQGRDVSIAVFNAYAPMIHLGALQAIADELKLELLNVAAEPYAVAKSMGLDDITDFNAIFIDIGGGTTDIAVVRNGGLEGTKMFALGGRAFTKRLAHELGVGFEEAEVLKIRYSEGKLGRDVSMKVERILEDDCNVWLSGIELSLSEFASSDLLPHRFFLCGGGSGLPGIKKALVSSGWTGNLPFARIPEVSFLQPKDVVNIKDETGELRDPQDITPMGLANLALDLVGEEKVMAGILRRAVKMIQK
ncbi:MAG TPA: cell division FtsA domain-containing protein [Candidatus Moranbacteria bacterium]|nr:cell division FtsA domain-containing protein [Candidatus Moranbacteria bacterium]